MSFYAKWRTASAMALGAALVVSSGCAETALVGQLDDSELQDLDVLPLAGLGISREVNDLMFSNHEYYFYGGFQDDIVIAGQGGFDEANSLGDAEYFFDTGTLNGTYAQTQEAIWAAYKVVDLAYVLYVAQNEGGGEPAFLTNPVVARGWLVAGQMERVMADFFCEATYQYGPTGGFNIQNLAAWARDNGFDEFNIEPDNINSKADMYERAAFAFERAAEQAERAVAAGDTTGQGADGGNDVGYNYFDAEIIRDAAYGGLAQVRMELARLGVDEAANMAAAVAAAANVPTDFVDYWNTDGVVMVNGGRENAQQNWTWDNDDLTHWGDTLTIDGVTRVWGSSFTTGVEAGDRRAERWPNGGGKGVNKCYEMVSTVGTYDDLFPFDDTGNLTVTHGTDGNDCAASADRQSPTLDMEYEEIPRWLLDNWSDEDRDIPAVDGTDARLVEAEVALMNDDLPLFTSKINEIRAFWGAPPISQPATAGALEYPNALDDGWSLLDREVVLENHGVIGRRLAALHGWDHPFITGSHVVSPHTAVILAETRDAGFQRGSCLPIPSDECNLNANINCELGN